MAGLNSFLALVFQFTVIYHVGVGTRSDVYYAVTIVVGFLYTVVFDAVNNALIPMFVEKIRERQGEVFFWNVMLVVLGLGSLILISSHFPILYAFPVLFKNLPPASASQIESLLVVYSIYLLVFCAVNAKNCYLYARGKALRAQLGVLFGWVVAHAAIWTVRPASDLTWIAACLVAGNTVALAFPNLESGIFSYRWGRLRQHSRDLLARAMPMTSSSAVLLLEPLVDGAIAARLGAGSLTVYHLFARGFVQINTVVHSGYIQPAVKRLAELVAGEQWEQLRQRIRAVAVRSSLLSLGLLLPLLPIIFILRASGSTALEPYVGIFIDHSLVLLLLLGFLCGPVFCKSYANGLFVLRREGMFVSFTMAAFAGGVIFKVLGASAGELPGLAFGTTVYWVFYAALIVLSFQKAVRERAAIAELKPHKDVGEAILPSGMAD